MLSSHLFHSTWIREPCVGIDLSGWSHAPRCRSTPWTTPRTTPWTSRRWQALAWWELPWDILGPSCTTSLFTSTKMIIGRLAQGLCPMYTHRETRSDFLPLDQQKNGERRGRDEARINHKISSVKYRFSIFENAKQIQIKFISSTFENESNYERAWKLNAQFRNIQLES